MQTIRVEDAVGMVLCHDITKIVPGEFKGAAFEKGHVVTSEDIPELLKLGKDHLYVWKLDEGMVHEDDAAKRIARAVKGQALILSEPKEGKVNLIASRSGLCSIEEQQLLKINLIEDIVVATRNHRRPVKKGDVVAGIRVVPLVIDAEKITQVEAICVGDPIIQVKPFKPMKIGVVTIGNEVYSGRIEDKFGSVIKHKAEEYECQVMGQYILPDDTSLITQAIHDLVNDGAEIVLTTGGMSVDPDDVTPQAIRETGAEIVTYGAPVLPGSMIMVAYLDGTPILGLPGCVMYHQTTVFDLILPIILSGDRVTRSMMARLGMGGLCLNCPECHYPACSFGTGA